MVASQIVESISSTGTRPSNTFQESTSASAFVDVGSAFEIGPNNGVSTDDNGSLDEEAAIDEEPTQTHCKRTKSTFERFRSKLRKTRKGTSAPRLASTLAMVTEQERVEYHKYTDNRLKHLQTVIWVPAAASLVVVAIFSVPFGGNIFNQTVWMNPLFAFVHWPLCIAFSMPLSAYIFKAIAGHEVLTSRWVLFRSSLVGACVPPIVFSLFQETGEVFPIPFATIVVNIPVGICTMACLFFSLSRDLRTKRFVRQTQLAVDICGMVTICAILYMAHFKLMASFDIRGLQISDISKGRWPMWQEVFLPWLRPM